MAILIKTNKLTGAWHFVDENGERSKITHTKTEPTPDLKLMQGMSFDEAEKFYTSFSKTDGGLNTSGRKKTKLVNKIQGDTEKLYGVKDINSIDLATLEDSLEAVLRNNNIGSFMSADEIRGFFEEIKTKMHNHFGQLIEKARSTPEGASSTITKACQCSAKIAGVFSKTLNGLIMEKASYEISKLNVINSQIKRTDEQRKINDAKLDELAEMLATAFSEYEQAEATLRGLRSAEQNAARDKAAEKDNKIAQTIADIAKKKAELDAESEIVANQDADIKKTKETLAGVKSETDALETETEFYK